MLCWNQKKWTGCQRTVPRLGFGSQSCCSLVLWSWASTSTSLGLSLLILKQDGGVWSDQKCPNLILTGIKLHLFSNKIRSWSLIYTQLKVKPLCLKWKGEDWELSICHSFYLPGPQPQNLYACVHAAHAHTCMCTYLHMCVLHMHIHVHICSSSLWDTPTESPACKSWTKSPLNPLPALTCHRFSDFVYFDT